MQKHYEKSSGGILYRIIDGNVEILLLEWLNSKGNKGYVIPKGHMEGDETAQQTALREISEETGLKIKDLEVIKFITKLNYTFTAGYLKNNPLIDKDVYLFLIKYTGTDTPIPLKEERFVGYKWFKIDEIMNIDVKFDLANLIRQNKTYFL